MGCENSKTDEKKTKETTKEISDPNIATNIKIPFQDALTSTDKKFRDMPDSPTGTSVGKGVKKIPNYICVLPYDKLDILREQFWMTRNKTDSIWEILQECCEVDEVQAEELLKTHHIVCLEGSLRDSYSREQPNYVYHIPNFCISDPFFERNYDQFEKIYDEVDDQNIKVNIFYHNDGKNYSLKIRNKMTGFDFKYIFAKMINLDKKKNNMRMFFQGQEILDIHCLYYHNVGDNATIYIMSHERKSEYQIKNKRSKKKPEITSETEKGEE